MQNTNHSEQKTTNNVVKIKEENIVKELIGSDTKLSEYTDIIIAGNSRDDPYIGGSGINGGVADMLLANQENITTKIFKYKTQEDFEKARNANPRDKDFDTALHIVGDNYIYSGAIIAQLEDVDSKSVRRHVFFSEVKYKENGKEKTLRLHYAIPQMFVKNQQGVKSANVQAKICLEDITCELQNLARHEIPNRPQPGMWYQRMQNKEPLKVFFPGIATGLFSSDLDNTNNPNDVTDKEWIYGHNWMVIRDLSNAFGDKGVLKVAQGFMTAAETRFKEALDNQPIKIVPTTKSAKQQDETMEFEQPNGQTITSILNNSNEPTLQVDETKDKNEAPTLQVSKIKDDGDVMRVNLKKLRQDIENTIRRNRALLANLERYKNRKWNRMLYYDAMLKARRKLRLKTRPCSIRPINNKAVKLRRNSCYQI